MNGSNATLAEWRPVAEEVAKALSVARAVERQQYPDGDTPVGLLPALVLAVAVRRAADLIAETRRESDQNGGRHV